MAKVIYPTIPENIEISIKISGFFYKSLAQLILGLVETLEKDKYKAIIEKFKNNEPASDIEELNIICLTALIFSIEMAAQEQKLTKDVEVDIPDEPTKEV